MINSYYLNKILYFLKIKNNLINLDKASAKKMIKKLNQLLYLENERNFHNLSSFSPKSIENKKELEKIKKYFRMWLNSPNYNIIFTSGATESLNMALKGIAFHKVFLKDNKNRVFNIVLSRIEHKAVLEIATFLERIGIEIRYMPVLKTGEIDKEIMNQFVDRDTILLSMPWVNNETGRYQPIQEVKKIKEDHHFLFHCDLSAGISYAPIDLLYYGIDLASFSAHKMCGLKGLGVLAINNIEHITPIIHGGGQQEGMRGGTENFASIKVWGSYMCLKTMNYQKDQKKINQLDSYLIQKLQEVFINEITFHSLVNKKERIPGIVNISLKGVHNLKLLDFLAKKNIYIGLGSACNYLHFENSNTLIAMGLTKKEMMNTLRISFDENNCIQDFNQLIKNIQLFKKKIYSKEGVEDNEIDLPDCESYRKLAFQYLLKKKRS